MLFFLPLFLSVLIKRNVNSHGTAGLLDYFMVREFFPQMLRTVIYISVMKDNLSSIQLFLTLKEVTPTVSPSLSSHDIK